MNDDVISDLWRVKDEIGQEHGYDLKRLAAMVRKREEKCPDRIVDWREAESGPATEPKSS